MHYYHALELDQHAMGAQILSSVNDVLRQQLVHISLDKMPGKSWPLELIATIITGAPMVSSRRLTIDSLNTALGLQN